MKKFVCSVCGYIYEGEEPPAECPVCHAPGSKFIEQKEVDEVELDEHVVGIAADADEDIKKDIRAFYEGECKEVGMYLAMGRAAVREGYPEIGAYWKEAAYDEAEHAAKFAELLGEVVSDSTKKNLEMRIEAEAGATKGRMNLAAKAEAAGLDAVEDTAHEIGKDEARHYRAFKALYDRYFG